ncbi:MAG: peptide/nickel transport system substrate-binding protein, partial [Thermacetogenium sp.]|nr:peptide/nickel transport system substrate-binding protein [Thermacetogenium sp.]
MARVNLRPRLRIIGWLLILGTALNLLIFAAAGCGAKKASRET